MIAFLHGILSRALPNLLWIEAGGVGYEVHVPLGSFDGVREGEKIRVLTHLHVREDAHTLYGFASEEQREVFLLLNERVSGIGPKLAIAVLGGMPISAFKAAVVQGDVAGLARTKGVGKKTAERMVLELKDKVGVAAVWEQSAADPGSSVLNDAVLGLIALGYKQVDALKAVRAAAVDHSEVDSNELVRVALRRLN